MIGFLVNPVAGMGGKVGLKGTDGVVNEAIERGAEPVSPKIAMKFLSSLGDADVFFLTASGNMGEESLRESGLRYRVVYHAPEITTALHTVEAAKKFLEEGVKMIVFVGGDGTARDVVSVADRKVPLLGIPSGVKMYSSCFAFSPEKAASLLLSFLKGETSLKEAEILDIDEEAYRKGQLVVRLYDTALVPYMEGAVQSAKTEYFGGNEEGAKEDIAEYVVENMEPDVLYIIGAGTTTAKIAEVMGAEKTVLGVDAYLNRKLLKKDLNEKAILKLLEKHHNARIIVSPIGAQGFIFGRGNQQISPEVIKKVGLENIMVVATPQKLKNTPELHIYTGDEEVDEALKGHIRVLSGYGRYTVKKVS